MWEFEACAAIRHLKLSRRQHRRRHRPKHDFISLIRILRMSGCVNRLLTASHLNFSKLYVSRVEVHCNGNLPSWLPLSELTTFGDFTPSSVLQWKAKKCKKFQNARAALSFRPVHLLFCHVLVAVVS